MRTYVRYPDPRCWRFTRVVERFQSVHCKLVPWRRVCCALLCSERVPITMPPVNLKQQFATRMKNLRGERGHSQEELAALARLHRTEVTKLESGERNPKLTTLAKVAQGLDMTMSELVESVGDKQDDT